MRDLPAPRLELVDDPRPALSATGEMSSRRDVASMASSKHEVRSIASSRHDVASMASQGTNEDAAARQLARLSLDQRAQVRAGDLVVAARQGGGARRRRRARASAAVAQLLAVIGPRVAHVCAADRWSMVVKCNDSNLVQRRNAQPGAASNG